MAGLRYSLAGDGVDGLTPSEASFAVDAHTGELIQLKVRRGRREGREGGCWQEGKYRCCEEGRCWQEGRLESWVLAGRKVSIM